MIYRLIRGINRVLVLPPFLLKLFLLVHIATDLRHSVHVGCGTLPHPCAFIPRARAFITSVAVSTLYSYCIYLTAITFTGFVFASRLVKVLLPSTFIVASLLCTFHNVPLHNSQYPLLFSAHPHHPASRET